MELVQRVRPDAILLDIEMPAIDGFAVVRDLPADQKAHWRDMFDHYVFANDDSVTAHIPEGGRGVLDPMTPELAARLRAFLLRALSR